MKKKSSSLTVPAFALQDSPPIYVARIPGRWLLKHTTPSWRIKDPEKGFQRLVRADRAKEIARTILEQDRVFPNSITLATTKNDFKHTESSLTLPASAKLLVVDGQHRLWAQKYSSREGTYACVVHMSKSEEQMAHLFLEINDNQRRVPSSLRWDLVRLVKPEGQEAKIMAAELVYELATRPDSPFYFALDLTGEQKDISVKQGSLAPEIMTLVSKSKKRKEEVSFDLHVDLLIGFFTAVRSLDPEGWGDQRATFYKTRVLRALTRILTDIIAVRKDLSKLSTAAMRKYLKKIDPTTLSEDRVRTAQGAAGVSQLYQEMRTQVFPS